MGASPTQPRKLKLLRQKKKRPQFDFCHCQNLTVPWRARLKLVHPSGLIQRKSLVSWWKKVEHCTHSRTHAMMQTIDYRFELSTAHVAHCQLPVRIHAGKNSNFRPYTNSNKTVFSKFSNSVKTAKETVMQTVFEKKKTHFHQQKKTVFKQ